MIKPEDIIGLFAILCFYGLIIVPIVIAVKNKRKKNDEKKAEAIAKSHQIHISYELPTKQAEIQAEDKNYKNSYQKRYILSMNEYYQFKKIKQITDRYNWLICPKIRLLDLIEPRTDADNYKSLLYKIQAKHIDFAICTQDMKVIALIEIDDNSHNRPDRIERDKFVDEVLQSVGYKILRTQDINEELFVKEGILKNP